MNYIKVFSHKHGKEIQLPVPESSSQSDIRIHWTDEGWSDYCDMHVTWQNMVWEHCPGSPSWSNPFNLSRDNGWSNSVSSKDSSDESKEGESAMPYLDEMWTLPVPPKENGKE